MLTVPCMEMAIATAPNEYLKAVSPLYVHVSIEGYRFFFPLLNLKVNFKKPKAKADLNIRLPCVLFKRIVLNCITLTSI